MKNLLRLLSPLLLILQANTADGQPSFTMKRPISNAAAPQVIGASPASSADWPATFIFSTPGGGCTSTAVGPRVILTAAHCVDNGATGEVRLESGAAVPVTCHHHPDYPALTSADYALCLAEQLLQGLQFERVSGDLSLARVGDDVILLGYGCTQEGGFDEGFGTLFEGTARVERTPTGQDLYLVTRGGAALCYGDSGGAAYVVTSPTQAPTRRQSIVGVNSRGDISQWSFLSATATTTFLDWALGWSEQSQVEICGLQRDTEYCRP